MKRFLHYARSMARSLVWDTRGWMNFGRSRIFLPKRHHLGRRVLRAGSYEPEVASILAGLAEPGSFVLDVGANIGLTAVALLERRDDIFVVSFEPSPNSLPYLRRTWDVSPYKTQWRVIESGCGERDGRSILRMSALENGAFDSFVNSARAPVTRSIEAPVKAIDTWWRESGCPQVTAVKIDVEGAERSVLEGMPQLLAKFAPTLIVEWNLHHMPADEQGWLIDFSASMHRKLVEVVSLAHVTSLSEIRIHLERGRDTFALLPN